MSPGLRAWSLWSAANDVLATATEPTPTVVWAAGVYVLHHSIKLAEIWSDQHPLDGEYGGGGTLSHPRVWRKYEIRSGRFTLSAPDRALLTVRTRAIEALVALDQVPAELVEACRTLHVERRRLSGITQDHNDRYIRCNNPPSRDEVLAHGELWGDIERRCRDAAAHIWEHVRPRPKPAQLELFAVGAGR
jgi:hypothetical protein